MTIYLKAISEFHLPNNNLDDDSANQNCLIWENKVGFYFEAFYIKRFKIKVDKSTSKLLMVSCTPLMESVLTNWLVIVKKTLFQFINRSTKTQILKFR